MHINVKKTKKVRNITNSPIPMTPQTIKFNFSVVFFQFGKTIQNFEK